jgi:hypothetical protein
LERAAVALPDRDGVPAVTADVDVRAELSLTITDDNDWDAADARREEVAHLRDVPLEPCELPRATKHPLLLELVDARIRVELGWQRPALGQPVLDLARFERQGAPLEDVDQRHRPVTTFPCRFRHGECITASAMKTTF